MIPACPQPHEQITARTVATRNNGGAKNSPGAYRIADSEGSHDSHGDSHPDSGGGLTLSPSPVRIITMPHKPQKPTSRPMSAVLRQAILDSKLPLIQIERETGVQRASVARFLRGSQSIVLDAADRLADLLGLELVEKPPLKRKAATRRKHKEGSAE